MIALSPVMVWLGVRWIRSADWKRPPSHTGTEMLLLLGIGLWLMPMIGASVLSSGGVEMFLARTLAYGVAATLGVILAWRMADAPQIRDLRLGLACLAVLLPIVSSVAIAAGGIARLFGVETDGVAHSTLELILQGGPTAAMLVVSAVVGAPIVEEVAYRLLFQGALRRLFSRSGFGDVLRCSLVVGVVFGLVHFGAAPAHAIPGLIALGIGLGIAREGLGIWPVIIAHAGFNIWNVLLAVMSAPSAEA